MVFVSIVITNGMCVCVCVCVVIWIKISSKIWKIRVHIQVVDANYDTPFTKKLNDFANLFTKSGGYNLCSCVACKIQVCHIMGCRKQFSNKLQVQF